MRMIDIGDTNGGGAPALPTNGTLETANPTDTTRPLAWNSGYWGNLTPIFTYPVQGRSGRGAKVQVTQYTDGDAKWVFDPITSSAGRTYTYSIDYTSDVATNISIEYHMTNGTYTYGWLGDPVASNGWTTFTNQFTVPTGADSFTVFQALVSVGSLTIDNVKIVDTTNGATLFPQGMITLAFDDTLSSQYTNARPILNAAGIKATYYAITDPDYGIGSDSSYMTWSQVQTLYAEGNEIGDHTRTHPDLRYPCLAPSDPNYEPSYCLLTDAQRVQMAQDEILGAKNDLMAHGMTPTTLTYPYGAYNETVKQLVKNAGFIGARSVNGGFDFPTSDKFALLDQHIESGTTVADVQGWIAQVQASHTWLILEFHDQTTSGPDQYHNSPAVLQGIVNAIQSSHITAVTLAQGVAMMNR